MGITIGGVAIDIRAKSDQLSADMAKAKTTVDSGMRSIQQAFDLAKGAMLALGGIGLAASLASSIKTAIELADAMNDLSQRVGISVKDLAKYELASKQSGTSMESLAKGIKGLAGNLMEHGDALRKAGIDATTADGAMRQMADVFARMPDGMEKTTLAVKLFGKSGMDLIPMLNMGAAGLDAAAEKSAKYAAAMATMAPLADAYNDNMAELAMHSKVAGMSLMNDMLPGLVAITGAMAEGAKQGGFWKGVMAGLDEFGNQAFDWSGNNARKGIRTLTKDLEDLQVQHDRITIDIFGAKGSIQTQIEEKTKALEAARKAYYKLTDGSVGGGRGSVNPANVKPAAADPLAEYKAIRKAIDDANKKTGDANKELERQAKLLAELSGLSGSFAEDWARLNAVYAAGKLTTEQLTTAQAALLAKQPAMQAAQKEQIEAAKAHTKAVDDEIDALEKLYQANEGHIRAARTMLENIEFETRLLGMNAEQRALATAERELERQGIVAGTQAYEAYIQAIREAVVNKGMAEANKKAAEDAEAQWQKAADQIGQSLTDQLMDGGRNGMEYIKNLFRTLVLRPVISAIVNPIAQGLTGALGLAGAANAATGGGDLSTAAAAAGIFGAGGIGGALAGGAGWLTGATTFGGALSAGASLIGTGTAAGAASGAGMIVGALGPIALGIGALVAIAKATKGETRSGGQYTYNAASGAMLKSGPSGGEISSPEVKAAINGTVQTINSLLKGMGSQDAIASAQAGVESSDRGRGGTFFGGTYKSGATFGESGKGDNYAGTLYERTSSQSPDNKAALENFTTDLVQGTIQALQAAELPKVIADMLTGVDAEALTNDAASALLSSIDKIVADVSGFRTAIEALPFENLTGMSFDAAAGLIAAAGGMDALQSKLGTYYENFYTEEEKRANTITNITAELVKAGADITEADVGGATREAFRAVVEATDPSSPLYVALLNVAGAFAGITPAAESAAAAASKLAANVGQSVGFDGRTVLGGADAAQYKIDAGFRTTVDGLQRSADLINSSGLNVSAAIAEAEARQQAAFAAQTGGGGVSDLLPSEILADSTIALAQAQAKLTELQGRAADSLDQFTGTLMDFINQMNTTDLGANSPEQQLAAARAEYERLIGEVSAGDFSEVDKLTSAARDLLTSSKTYNASGAGFVADDAFVRSTFDLIKASKLYDDKGLGQQIIDQQADIDRIRADGSRDFLQASHNFGFTETESGLTAKLAQLNEAMDKVAKNTGAQVTISQEGLVQTVAELKTGNTQQAQAAASARFEGLRNV